MCKVTFGFEYRWFAIEIKSKLMSPIANHFEVARRVGDIILLHPEIFVRAWFFFLCFLVLNLFY